MIKYFCFVLMGIQITDVSAHEFLTDILVYPVDSIYVSPESTFGIINTFYLNEDDLNKGENKKKVKQEIKRIVAHSNGQQKPEKSIVCDDYDIVFKTCGEVDDWSKARLQAIEMCSKVADEYGELFPDGLIPQFINPVTFTDTSPESDHHSAYSFSHGLTFNCIEIISLMPTF